VRLFERYERFNIKAILRDYPLWSGPKDIPRSRWCSELVPFNDLGKWLIVFGVILVILGAVFTLAGKVPWLGRLPGDIYIQRRNVTFYFPLITPILLSVVLSLLLSLFFRR
jgi:hypothetical protein